MKILAAKEKSISANSSLVNAELKKTANQLKKIKSEFEVVKTRYSHKLQDLRKSQIYQNNDISSLASLKRKILKLSKENQNIGIKLNDLIFQNQILQKQKQIVNEKIAKQIAFENAVKLEQEQLEIIDQQSILKALCLNSQEQKVNQSQNISRTLVAGAQDVEKNVTQEISLTLSRQDGVGAKLNISHDATAVISASVQTQFSSTGERESLKKKLKQALKDKNKDFEVVIEGVS